MIKYKFYLLFCLAHLSNIAICQTDSLKPVNINIDSLYNRFAANIYMDSIVITAIKSGFDVQDFIHIIKTDKSFEKSFHNLRTLNYEFDNRIYFLNNINQIISSYTGTHIQHIDQNCRSMEILNSKTTGKFYKKKHKYKYITAKLYDKLFYTKDTICQDDINGQYTNNSKKTNSRIQKLKTLIFSPGQAVNVPLIGKKMAIFSDRMIPYYDYTISFENYQDSIPCFVFKVKTKPDADSRSKKTVIKYLNTYIHKKTMQIVAREYQLYYDHFLYDFDVKIEIQLIKHQNLYAPLIVKYDGNWDVIGKKEENAVFEINFKY